MEPSPGPDATQLLAAECRAGASQGESLFNLVYEELRSLAGRYLRSERPDHTLQPTALVHEAYLKMVDQTRVDWQGRTHFFAVGAQAMRRILVDHARSRARQKRGGNLHRITLDEAVSPFGVCDLDVLALQEALERMSQLDPRQARVVELRFLAGLTVAEVAEVMGLSKRTVEGEWTHAKAWLKRELTRA